MRLNESRTPITSPVVMTKSITAVTTAVVVSACISGFCFISVTMANSMVIHKFENAIVAAVPALSLLSCVLTASDILSRDSDASTSRFEYSSTIFFIV